MNPEHMAGPSEPRGINHGELDEEARKQPLMTLGGQCQATLRALLHTRAQHGCVQESR